MRLPRGITVVADEVLVVVDVLWLVRPVVDSSSDSALVTRDVVVVAVDETLDALLVVDEIEEDDALVAVVVAVVEREGSVGASGVGERMGAGSTVAVVGVVVVGFVVVGVDVGTIVAVLSLGSVGVGVGSSGSGPIGSS